MYIYHFRSIWSFKKFRYRTIRFPQLHKKKKIYSLRKWDIALYRCIHLATKLPTLKNFF